MKRNDCDTDPEANAGSVVDDGFDRGACSGTPPCWVADGIVQHSPRCSWYEEVSDGVDSGAVPGQPAG